MRAKKSLFLFLILMIGLWLGQAEAASDAPFFSPDASYIDLGDTEVTDWDAFYAYLDGFANLEQVDMFATPVGRSRINELVERYPDIKFGWTMQFAEHTVRTDATAFSTLHLSGQESHSTRELSILQYCTELRALDIGHNAADDLSFLYSLPELRVLIIACNMVEDITPLASLEHLEYLEMFSNWVEDISPLKELPHLKHLNIGYNNIRDLSPLHEMPQLKRLWLKKCHSRLKAPALDDEVIDALQTSLPGCEIDTESNPSEGGWRDEAHYGVFHEYFRTGQYVPFADSPMENR